MVTLEYLANFSNVTDLLLYGISGITIFYGLKVKFIKQSEKAAHELEMRVFDRDNKDSIINKAFRNAERIDKLVEDVNSLNTAIGRIEGKINGIR